MEEEKKAFAARLEAFFAGKGFYIVLFLCVAVIGLSAWSMLSAPARKTGDAELSLPVSGMDDEIVMAEFPVSTAPSAITLPAPTSEPAPVSIPEDPVTVPAATSAPTANLPSAAEIREYYIWPVAGPVERPYSVDALLFDRTMRDWRTHDGIDIAAELGTQVKAVTSGKIAEIRTDDLYGTTVVVSHRDGLVSVYSNLAALPAVAVGDRVDVGQVIGAVGDTAICEAGEVCHLHFAMLLDGVSVDPGDYLP